MFDIDRLTRAAIEAIAAFAKEHPDELFYAFAIDDDMLCLNTVAAFEQSLAHYRKEYPDAYQSEEEVKELRENTGDWEYQGFFAFARKHGFDNALSAEHYEAAMESDDGHAPDTEYAKAMTQIIQSLIDQNAFAPLRRTDDFSACWVDHSY